MAMKVFKYLALIVLGVMILAAGSLAVHYYLLHKVYNSRLAEIRKDYRTRRSELLNGLVSLDRLSDCHAFVNASVIDDLLRALSGITVPVSGRASFNIKSLKFTTTDGAPYVTTEGVFYPDASSERAGIAVEGIVTLSPPSVRGSTFTTRVHLVAIKPVFVLGDLQLALHGFAGDLVNAYGQERIEQLSEIELPIGQNFEINVPAVRKKLSFKTRPPEGDHLDGVLQSPAFKLSSGLTVKDTFFMEDGLHLFLTLNDHVTAPAVADPAWGTLSEAERWQRLSDPTLSYFVRINREGINLLLKQFAALPPAQRTVSFVSTGLSGNFYYDGHDTFFGRKEEKVYLEHPDAAQANVEATAMQLDPHPTGLTAFKLAVAIRGHVQFHWHFDPGPGGGFGGNVGAGIEEKTAELSGHLEVANNNPPLIEGFLDGPASSAVRVVVGLGHLGNKTFDQSVPLPVGEFFRVPLPSGIRQNVSIDVAGKTISRRINLSAINLKPQPDTIQVGGQIAFEQIP